ncbi:MAG: Hsp20/alpha crystallin family protein [Acidimicrobiales bacterium]
MLLMQNDPFRDLDLFFRDTKGGRQVPMDAYRRGDDVWVHVDLPGVGKDSIDIDVERSVLTITATRNWRREEGDQVYMNERTQGTVRRQVHLGDSLDVEGIEADFSDGVLTLRIPVSAKAKPKKISIGSGTQPAIDVESTPA